MLEMFGSLASLIGLSMQMYSRFQDRHPTPLGQYMAVLVVVTDTAQCWKDIHHRYQSLSSDLEALRRNLLVSDGLNVQAKRVEDIAPSQIRNIFESGTLQDAVYSFETDLSVAFEPLQRAASLPENATEKFLDEIQAFGRNDLTRYVRQILVLQQETVVIHGQVCKFLSEVREMLENPIWDNTQIFYILKNRAYIHTRFDKCIINADTALLNFMSIVKFVVDQVRDGEV